MRFYIMLFFFENLTMNRDNFIRFFCFTNPLFWVVVIIVITSDYIDKYIGISDLFQYYFTFRNSDNEVKQRVLKMMQGQKPKETLLKRKIWSYIENQLNK